MVRQPFEQLSTEKFRLRMQPKAVEIYSRLFPGCRYESLRSNGETGVHILDKEFAIDSMIVLPSGQYYTIQEKYRQHKYLKYAEFTQEYRNADGTEHESNGEWFKLAAQLYFYGWANESESNFEKWALLDVMRYKALVENAGGLGVIGTKKLNWAFGRSSFYAIPMNRLYPAIIADYMRNWVI